MGVYRAVKIVHRSAFEDIKPFERELSGIRKFEPISRSHEGFVDVLQVGIGQQEEYFYYVMELGDDQHLGQQIDPEHYTPKTLAKEITSSGRLSFQRCLDLGLALSLALGELHRQRLVHRDIKPSNIIFVNGIPKLADIGLVAEIKEAPSFVGTVGFIPPEGPGTPSADVYGLGKVLYEASTGKDRQDFPEMPTQWDKLPDHQGLLELNEVILQACREDPAKRYQSGREMHAHLVAIANGKSIKRLNELERRIAHFKQVGGGVLAAVLLSVIIAYPVYTAWRRGRDLREQQVGANVAYGTRAMEMGDLAAALPYFAEAQRRSQSSGSASISDQLRFGSVRAQCPKLHQMWFGLTDLQIVDFSQDGRHVLAVQRHGTAQVFDLASEKPISPPFGPNATKWRGTLNKDGSKALIAAEDKTATVWEVTTGTKLMTLGHPAGRVFAAGFSPDSKQIVTGCEDNNARIWNAETGILLLELKEHSEAILFAAFSRDGKMVVTTGRDETALIWDVATGRRIGPALKHPTWVGYADFSPDGKLLVTGCFDHKARIWEVPLGRPLFPDLAHDDGVNSVQFSPDGRIIAAACLDHTVRLWRTSDHQPLVPNSRLRHTDRVTQAVFSPEGRRIATACIDGSLRIWDFAAWNPAILPKADCFSEAGTHCTTVTKSGLRTLDVLSRCESGPEIQPAFPVRSALLSPNGKYLLVGSKARETEPFEPIQVQIYDTQVGKPIGPLCHLSSSLTNLLLSPEGKWLVAYAGTDAQSWDMSTGKCLVQLNWTNGGIKSGTFAPVGHQVATWHGDKLRVWDAISGKESFPAINFQCPIAHAEFSPDGKRLVACCADQGFTKCPARIIDAADGKWVGPPLLQEDGILFAAFSPDGRRVATAGEDFSAVVWDAFTGSQITPPLKHNHQVFTVSFSPDSKWVVTASADRTVRVWNAETGDPLTPPLKHIGFPQGARFLGNGRCVATSLWQDSPWLWFLPVEERPISDLAAQARLLSGDMVIPSGGLTSARGESHQALWQRLRSRYPSDFAVSETDAADWHWLQAQESEVQGNWFAAAFHLRRLLAMHPQDGTVAEKLAAAERKRQASH
jgi:WD40 repeat protein